MKENPKAIEVAPLARVALYSHGDEHPGYYELHLGSSDCVVASYVPEKYAKALAFCAQYVGQAAQLVENARAVFARQLDEANHARRQAELRNDRLELEVTAAHEMVEEEQTRRRDAEAAYEALRLNFVALQGKLNAISMVAKAI